MYRVRFGCESPKTIPGDSSHDTFAKFSYGYSKDFERLLGAMADIASRLEPVSLEADTFTDSAMISSCLVGLYAHIAIFWTIGDVGHTFAMS